MIQRIVLFKLNPELDDETLDWMLRETRLRILRIPVVLSIRCGYRIDPGTERAFFFSVDLASQEKLAAMDNSPEYQNYFHEVAAAHTEAHEVLDFETEPGTDPLFC